jgi:hypothetical protein
MKIDRWFYSSAAALFLVAIVVAFHDFILEGRGTGGRVIGPEMFRLDAVHGACVGLWFLLFLVQSLLIASKNRQIHLKLGWAAVAIGLGVVVTGPWVATQSVMVHSPKMPILGMLYSQFLLMMYAEIALFTVFATLGILMRKKPRIHRPVMLMASMSLLPPATTRMPFLGSVFGAVGGARIFGPVFVLGALLLIVRWMMTRSLDRWLAMSYGALVVVLIGATGLARTSAWGALAAVILKR